MSIIDELKKDLDNYRCIPFWSWNDKLEEGELRRQIRKMKEYGMGGFFMHARAGLQTDYLSQEWMNAVSVCIDEAKNQGLRAWCYDENGYPSGFAGLKLLDDKENLIHYLTCETKDCFDDSALSVYIVKDNKIVRIMGNDNSIKEYICVYDNVNSSYVDVLNKCVVKKFIEETHEKYYAKFKNKFGNVMPGFFTDEPQYFRWNTAYTPVLLHEFKNEYNEDVLDGLATLFVDADNSYEFRFKYWRLMNKLLTESFWKQIFEWCEQHNCMLTGHTIEEQILSTQMWCCAGAMPIYEYEHIPGIDWLGREIGTELAPRQVSSVAQQLGKKQVITETFACTGWDVSPKELKRVAEWQFVNGVNLICQHLYPYSIRGQRKRDFPTFFSDHNPWTSYSKAFNDYFTSLGYLLTESKEVAKVGIIHPMHATYLTYNREKDYESVRALETSFSELIERFGAANIGHHYIDELILEKHGYISESSLFVGECAYDYIVIPQMDNLDSSTVKLLKEFLFNGGKLLLCGERPQYIDGKKANLDFLQSNITFEEIKNTGVVISDDTTAIRSTYRKSKFGNFLYTVNLSKDKGYSVSFEISENGAKIFDIENKTQSAVFFEKTQKGIAVPLYFKPGQSYIIAFDDTIACGEKNTEDKMDSVKVSTDMLITEVTENALTVDCAAISYDNILFGDNLPIMGISDYLLSQQKNQTVFLKYCFNVKEIPNSIYLEAENGNYKNVWLNSKIILFSKEGHLDRSFIRHDIKSLIKIGVNEVIFEIDYFQSDQINKVLFDTVDGMENLINCLSYDTEIEAIYILGDFCVESVDGYYSGEKDTLISKGNFTIQKSQKSIDISSVTKNGYPFFAGELTAEKEINLSKIETTLKIYGRFSVAKIYINSQFLKTIMFDEECDLSPYAKIGKNILKIKIVNSNRNIFGPFHYKPDPEPIHTGPGVFSLQGSWISGKSDLYSEDYAFVNFGLKSIELI